MDLPDVLTTIGLFAWYDQLVRFRSWQWDQMLSPVHHEGFGLYALLLAAALKRRKAHEQT